MTKQEFNAAQRIESKIYAINCILEDTSKNPRPLTVEVTIKRGYDKLELTGEEAEIIISEAKILEIISAKKAEYQAAYDALFEKVEESEVAND